MVRPDLRRDMAGIPKISGPQERERERERERCGALRGNVFAMGCPQSLVGNLVPREENKPRPSARILRK
jgi:hypothetical protein